MTAWYQDLGGGRFGSSPACAGPWSPDDQHGGPPSALLAGALEATQPRDDMITARVTFEILGPIKIDDLTVETRVTRPGRRVERVEGTLVQAGRPVLAASAWRISRTSSSTPLEPAPAVPTARELADRDGYLGSIEWAPIAGSFTVPGPTRVWTRMRGTVVDGVEPTPLQRVVAVADSGNGVSSVFPMDTTWFINPELTVHLHREAVGSWILLDAVTVASAGGAGLATSVLSDSAGPLGRGAQSLLVAPR